MKQLYLVLLFVISAAGCTARGRTATVGSPSAVAAGEYEAWVASESADEVSVIRLSGMGATLVTAYRIGTMPVEIDGPHGVAVAPRGDFVYATLAHGQPNGSLLKIDRGTGRILSRLPLGQFPATVAVTPDGQTAFVSNFNLHGDPVRSSISMVHLPSMRETARIETCIMPHGSRVNAEGTMHYSVCMMDEELVEIDVRRGTVARRFSVGPGMEGPVSHDAHAEPAAAGAAPPPAAGCSPTWAEPSVSGASVFVTCNRARVVLEIDVARWEVVRRFATGDAPYNLAVTPDGSRLLVSLRSRTEAGLEVYDLTTAQRIGKVAASTVLAHGIAVTPDSRYAVLTAEGVGAEPGRVDVIDLQALRRTATVEVGPQATGVALVP